MYLTYICLLILYCNVHREYAYPTTKNTLEQVSVVFRHGNRYPDKRSAYPNSPYKNGSFYPDNLGEITLKGQKTMYYLGRELRYRYNTFLGGRYFTNLVESISSSYARCQMSAQAVHAGLFGTSRNNPVKFLSWQAVLFSVIPPNQDNLISVHLTCPKMTTDAEYPENNDADVQIAFQALSNYAGYPDAINYVHARKVYDYLKTGLENDLPIPDEFVPYYPEPLQKTALQGVFYAYKGCTGLIGPLIRRITESAIAKATNTLLPENRKLFLYSGHDMNIWLILQALNIRWWDEWIHYGAAIIFELHNIEGIYGFKVFLRNNYIIPKLLDIPGCGTFCPLSWFVELGDGLSRPSICDS